jgi:tricorn protease-like protein
MNFFPKYLKAILCIQIMFFYSIDESQNPSFWNDIQAFKKQDNIAMPADYKNPFYRKLFLYKLENTGERFAGI